MWLIATVYLLIIVVGAVQIFWAFRYGNDYKSPTIDGFYMIYRMILSLCVIFLFTMQRRALLCWTIIIESATNIFVSLYFIYYALWYICQSESAEQFQVIVAWSWIHTVCSAFLCLISIAVLGYIISTWKQVMTHQSV